MGGFERGKGDIDYFSTAAGKKKHAFVMHYKYNRMYPGGKICFKYRTGYWIVVELT